MLPREFDRQIRLLATPVLQPLGFSADGGRGCTFRREIGKELFHFVAFELNGRGESFEVWVFPGSPRFGAEQWADFPDHVGIPTGRSAALNAKLGVGHGASRFPCKTKDVLASAFGAVVGSALENHVEQYLSRFQTLASIVPYLEHPQWAACVGEA